MISESVQHRPAPALRPLVAWYAGYRQAGLPPGRHRGLPSPYLTLIVTLDDPLVVAEHPDPRQPASQHGVLVGGLHTVPALITHDGRQSGIQLHVTPLGARALLASRGAMPIAGLSRETGWTTRHLGARFRDEFGLSPKAAARVVRFDRARRLLQRRVTAGRAPALAELAASGGYYDQAHLAREFRELAGCAPSRWRAEEFRNVQAGTAAAGEGSQA
jgi:AraC-like DNA-binding protein